MAEIKSSGQELEKETIKLSIDGNNADFEGIRIAARDRAREINGDAMMLSWHNSKTGDFWPTYDCGGGGDNPWEVYANSRGSNLTIDVNNGDYTFYFLKF